MAKPTTQCAQAANSAFRGRLFSTYHLRDVLSGLKQTMFRAIDSLTEDELCSSSSEDGLKQLVGKYTVTTPQIDELGIYSETRAPKVVIRNLFRNGSDEEGTSVDESGTRVLVHVPFTGTQSCLNVVLRTVPPPCLALSSGTVSLCLTMKDGVREASR